MRLALVTWLDAGRTDDTVTGHEDIGIRRQTVGWVLRNDEKGVVLAMTHDAGEYERGFFIPRLYIEHQRVLQVGKRLSTEGGKA